MCAVLRDRSRALPLTLALALLAGCASDDVPGGDVVDPSLEEGPQANGADAELTGTDLMIEEPAMILDEDTRVAPGFTIDASGEIRDAAGTRLYAPGEPTTELVAALPEAASAVDELPLRVVAVDAAAPAAAIVTFVQTCHAPEAAACIVRLQWDDASHDIARPQPPTSGPFAELPIILRFNEPFSRITAPASGGTGWVRVPGDTSSLTSALREEAQRNDTSRVIVSFPSQATAAVVKRVLGALTAAGFDDVTFAGTF